MQSEYTCTGGVQFNFIVADSHPIITHATSKDINNCDCSPYNVYTLRRKQGLFPSQILHKAPSLLAKDLKLQSTMDKIKVGQNFRQTCPLYFSLPPPSPLLICYPPPPTTIRVILKSLQLCLKIHIVLAVCAYVLSEYIYIYVCYMHSSMHGQQSSSLVVDSNMSGNHMCSALADRS